MKTHIKHLPIVFSVIAVFVCSASIVFADDTEPTFMTKIVWGLVTGLFGRLMWIGGALLDWGIQDFIIGFGAGFKNSGVGLAVDTLWVSVRDIFNISFIFGLVYIGLKMILNPDDSGSKRWLIHLIIAALLINFSLYITKFVVDFSNILASQIASSFTDAAGNVNVSATFMNQLGITSSLDANTTKIPQLVGDSVPWGYIFGAAITFLVAGFVFAVGGVLLIIRYAVLCIYMVLSPLMFLGWVFPGLQRVSSEYWSGFLGRAFFAPMYILMLYFAATVLQSFASASSSAGKSPDFAGIYGGSGPVATNTFQYTLPPFILGMVFLVAAVVVANKMGAHGAAGAVSIMNKAKEKTQHAMKRTAIAGAKAAGSPVTVPARHLTSLAGNKLNRKISALQQRQGAVGAVARLSPIAGAARAGASKMENARYGWKNTAAQTRKEQNDINERAERGRQRTEAEEKLEVQRLRLKENQDKLEREGLTDDQKTATLAEIDDAKNKITDAETAIGALIHEMSNDELLEMHIDALQSADIAMHLSDAQIKALKDSGRFTNEQIDGADGKGGVLGSRNTGTFAKTFKALDGTATSAKDAETALSDLGKTVRAMSDERVQGLDYDKHLTNERVAMNLTDKQIESLEKSGKYSTDQITKIKAARDRGLTAVASGDLGTLTNSAHTDDLVDPSDPSKGSLKDSQRRGLMSGKVQVTGSRPPKVFAEPKMAEHITPEVLNERMRNGLTEQEKVSVRDNINKYIAGEYGTPDASKVKLWKKWSEDTRGAWLGLTFDSTTTGGGAESVIRDANGNPINPNPSGTGNNQSNYPH